MDHKVFHSHKAPPPVGAYPHARRVGDLLFLSGVGPRQAGTDAIPGGAVYKDTVDYDFSAQCVSVFNNVEAILESAGLGLANLVDVTVFLVNMKRDFALYNQIYKEYLQKHQPCRTTVEVSALPTPIAIELKCIASYVI